VWQLGGVWGGLLIKRKDLEGNLARFRINQRVLANSTGALLASTPHICGRVDIEAGQETHPLAFAGTP
jgi:hypothetical protein